jgi:hypothetical protein
MRINGIRDSHSYRSDYVTGTFYTAMPVVADSVTNLALVADTMVVIPAVIERTLTIDRLGLEVGVLDAGKIIRLGIYTATSVKYPGSLIKDFGTIDAGSTGPKQTGTLATILIPGLYFLVCSSDGAPSVYAQRYAWTPLGMDVSTHMYYATNNYSWLKLDAGSSGALPATFPAGGSLPYGTRAPCIVYRIG